MKIVFLSDDFPPLSFGGAGISTCELAKGMQKAGHEVSVITTCRKREEEGEVIHEGLSVYRIYSDYRERWRAWRSLYNPSVVKELAVRLEAVRPDVVHANNVHYHLSYYALVTAKRYAKRVVLTFRDTMAVTYGKLATPRYLSALDAKITWIDNLRQAHLRYNPFRNVVIRRMLRSVDVMCSVSEALARALAQNGITGVLPVHTGIDPMFSTAEDRKALAEIGREKFGLGTKKIILFGGRIGAGKGHAQALEALKLVRTRMPDAVLVVMGGALQKAEDIIYTGWIDGEDKRALYAAADVVWVPSGYLDPLPRMVLEAMAAGKPVVGSRYGGSPEAIKDGVTGYVVNPFEVEQVVQKTLDLLGDTEKAERFGSAALERIRGDFALERCVRRYIDYYAS